MSRHVFMFCRRSGTRLHSCLSCINFSCWGRCMKEHTKTCNHRLWMDLEYGHVYCAACQDYVYDAEFLAISEQHQHQHSRELGLGTKFVSWAPSSKEVDLLADHTRRLGFSKNSTTGLRGLINLGNTCFMSCIVQVLIHTPQLRDYFLSDRHMCQANSENACIVCEISQLFQDFFCGQGSPLSPHKLLYMIWTHAHHLAGYEQQDAHEFFIATLDLLHRHLIYRHRYSF